MIKNRATWFSILSLLLAVFLLGFISPTISLSAGVSECLDCHDDIDEDIFNNSPHAKVQCTGCHFEVTDIDLHEEGEIEIGEVECAKCHKGPSEELAASIHGMQDVGCNDCHPDIHELPGKPVLAESVAVCSECHDDTGFEGSIHAVAVERGIDDSPTCATCHGFHDIEELGDITSRERRLLTVESCTPCHGKEELAVRHGLSSEYVDCYEESYHGKVFSLGYCTTVAGCSDCHTAHNIRPQDDPRSSVNTANLAATCGVERCHPGSNLNFALYAPHASHRDKDKYPIFYWTFIIMSGLLIVVFAFFWLHTILWWQRSFRERREMRLHGEHKEEPELALEGEVYTRFNLFGILMHFLMMISFLGLVFTGLPLKFPHAFWAPAMMRFWGGAEAAGNMHRYCALITFFYFLCVNISVIYWLFMKKTGENLIKKFFGPDSLFPNMDDLRAIGGMFKWFFNAGPKPEFGRWTYWEKFDFLAVYWGMFAIGFTGLMLWFPTFFAKFLPGWLFNVATIVHSDEALLATGFIFTVHFFNTHLRPEKFPMDLVIFTGKISRHEMIEERSNQIRLEKQKGVMEDMKTGYSSGIFEFISQVIGYAAVLIGLSSLYFIWTGMF